MRPQQVLGVYKPQTAITHDPRVSRKMGCGKISELDLPEFVETRAKFPTNLQVYVTSIPIQCDQKCIYDIFKEYGTIRQIKMLTGTVSAHRKSLHAVISYGFREHVRLALEVKRKLNHEGEFMTVIPGDWWKASVSEAGTSANGWQEGIKLFEDGEGSRESEELGDLNASGNSYRQGIVRPLDMELPIKNEPLQSTSTELCRCPDCEGRSVRADVPILKRRENKRKVFDDENENETQQMPKENRMEMTYSGDFSNSNDTMLLKLRFELTNDGKTVRELGAEKFPGDKDIFGEISNPVYCTDSLVLGKTLEQEMTGEHEKVQGNVYEEVCSDIDRVMGKATDDEAGDTGENNRKIRIANDCSRQSGTSPEETPFEAELLKRNQSKFERSSGVEKMLNKIDAKAYYEEISKSYTPASFIPEMSFEKELFRRSRLTLTLNVPVKETDSGGTDLNGNNELSNIDDKSTLNIVNDGHFKKVREVEKSLVDENEGGKYSQELQTSVEMVEPKTPPEPPEDVFVKEEKSDIVGVHTDEVLEEVFENTRQDGKISDLDESKNYGHRHRDVLKSNFRDMKIMMASVDEEISRDSGQANWTWPNAEVPKIEKDDDDILIIYEKGQGFEKESGSEERMGEMCGDDELLEKIKMRREKEWDIVSPRRKSYEEEEKEEKAEADKDTENQDEVMEWKRHTRSGEAAVESEGAWLMQTKRNDQYEWGNDSRWKEEQTNDESSSQGRDRTPEDLDSSDNSEDELSSNVSEERDKNESWGDKRKLNRIRGRWNNRRNNWVNNRNNSGGNNWNNNRRNNWGNNRNRNGRNNGGNNGNNNGRNSRGNNGNNRRDNRNNYGRNNWNNGTNNRNRQGRQQNGMDRGRWSNGKRGDGRENWIRDQKWGRGGGKQKEEGESSPGGEYTKRRNDPRVREERRRNRERCRSRSMEDKRVNKEQKEKDEKGNGRHPVTGGGNQARRSRGIMSSPKGHYQIWENGIGEVGPSVQKPGESELTTSGAKILNQMQFSDSDSLLVLRLAALQNYFLNICAAVPPTSLHN